MEKFTQKIDDGICKGFKNWDETIDFFINKAYDEESKTHALLLFIPKIPEFNILQVQNPVFYESEEERDRIYRDNMNEEFVNTWFDMLCTQIREQRAQATDLIEAAEQSEAKVISIGDRKN